MSARDGSASPPDKRRSAAERTRLLSVESALLLQALVTAGIAHKSKHAQLDLAEELDANGWHPEMAKWALSEIRSRVGTHWKESAANQLSDENSRQRLVDGFYTTKRERIGLDHHFDLDADKKARGFAQWMAKNGLAGERETYEQRIAERYDELIQFNKWAVEIVPERYVAWLVVTRAEVKEKEG